MPDPATIEEFGPHIVPEDVSPEPHRYQRTHRTRSEGGGCSWCGRKRSDPVHAADHRRDVSQ